MGAGATGLEWWRPAGFLLCAWLVPLWILWRRKRLPVRLASGMLALWKSLGGSQQQRAVSRAARIPPRAWLWMAGLVLGSLAVAGPHGRALATSAPSQHLVLDRSPSMFLPLAPGQPQTRYERALELALVELERAQVPEAARVWTSAGESPRRGARPPDEWRRAPRAAGPELDATLFERPELNLVTDRARPAAGGLFASGGQAAPGAVGEWRGEALEWDGQVVALGAVLPAQVVSLEGTLAPRLRKLIEIWADERGLRLGPPAPTNALSIVGRGGAAGWREAEGRLVIGSESLEPSEGDPAAWAVGWSRRFDDSLLTRPGQVPLGERRAAGAEVAQLSAGAAPISGSHRLPAAAWLALASLLAAIGAFFPATLESARNLQ